jgi:hypothetical protein
VSGNAPNADNAVLNLTRTLVGIVLHLKFVVAGKFGNTFLIARLACAGEFSMRSLSIAERYVFSRTERILAGPDGDCNGGMPVLKLLFYPC